MEYISLSQYLKDRYGCKVYKLSLQSGCSCPNRDGTLGRGGCTFCSEGGSGDFAAPLLSIPEQIRQARKLVDGKFPAGTRPQDRRYIAYFQSYTNTYGDPERLRKIYSQALACRQIVALSVGTRPDCLPDEMIEILKELGESCGKDVWVELGLQTIHERTARAVHRGYSFPVFEDALRRLDCAGLSVIVHLILGLPGESEEDMLESVRCIADLSRRYPSLDGVKLQLLHVLRGTQMGEEYLKDPFPLPSLEEYSSLIVRSLKILPENMVIHRMTGDAPRRLLIAPRWSMDKKHVMNTIHKKIRMAKRNESE